MRTKRLNDTVVQSRVDSRFVATILKYSLINIRNHPRSISELVRTSIENYAYTLVDNKLVSFVETTEEADELISTFFGDFAGNPSGRGRMNKHLNLNADDLNRNNKLILSDPGYEKVINRGLVGDMTLEQFRAEAKRNVRVDDDGLVINETQPQKPVIPEWADKPSNNKQPVECEEKYNPDDRFTMRKMTEDELIEKERLRNERDQRERELMDQMARDMKSSIKN